MLNIFLLPQFGLFSNSFMPPGEEEKRNKKNLLQAILDIRVKQKVYSTIKKNERTSSKLRLLY